MRYFSTTNASRPYRAGGFTFRFDSLDFAGGSWTGVLSVEQEGHADALAGLGPPVKEITEAEFNALKKKQMTSPFPSSSESETQSSGMQESKEKHVADNLEAEISLGKADFKDPLSDTPPAPAKPRRRKKEVSDDSPTGQDTAGGEGELKAGSA